MKKIARKGKEAVFFVFSPEILLMGFLGFLYYGSQAALLGFAIYKVYGFVEFSTGLF